MVHFIRCSFHALFHSGTGWMDRSIRVTPFGHPGVDGYVLLTPAFRSLSRPSSPYSSKASAINLYSLGHIILPSCIPSRASGTLSNQARAPSTRAIHEAFFVVFLPLRFQRTFFMEIRGLEPLTLGLQSRCSSQLS